MVTIQIPGGTDVVTIRANLHTVITSAASRPQVVLATLCLSLTFGNNAVIRPGQHGSGA